MATAGSWPPVQSWPGARRCGSGWCLNTNLKNTTNNRTTPKRAVQAPPPPPRMITRGCSASGSGGSESGLKFWWTTSYPPLPMIGMPNMYYLLDQWFLTRVTCSNEVLPAVTFCYGAVGILESLIGTKWSFFSPTHPQIESFGGVSWKRRMQSKSNILL